MADLLSTKPEALNDIFDYDVCYAGSSQVGITLTFTSAHNMLCLSDDCDLRSSIFAIHPFALSLLCLESNILTNRI